MLAPHAATLEAKLLELLNHDDGRVHVEGRCFIRRFLKQCSSFRCILELREQRAPVPVLCPGALGASSRGRRYFKGRLEVFGGARPVIEGACQQAERCGHGRAAGQPRQPPAFVSACGARRPIKVRAISLGPTSATTSARVAIVFTAACGNAGSMASISCGFVMWVSRWRIATEPFSSAQLRRPYCFQGTAEWAQQGLNLRPLPCEGSALPLSYTPQKRGHVAIRIIASQWRRAASS